jgi:uncharacterized lipoprotein YehR (DUF1307 family)
MIRTKNMLMFGLVLSFIIVGCGKKQEQSEYIGQQVKEEASQIKDSITKQTEEMEAKGGNLIDQAKSEAVLIKDKTASIINELIAKAKRLLNQGKFNEAIVTAQDVLNNYDSDSQEAKDIIAKAKEKLKSLATTATENAKERLEAAATEENQGELESAATEKVEDVKRDITDPLRVFDR